ncbi:MAG: hypothetical protein HXX08_05985 [Chloroflexi bacterium]|uniref:Glycosyltransferase RgtA/B/C/D-like domain-containing protein n=1 Tax=Candidatus Chlorohelix allophototropha TaxID=3003348 RepID=A0A8T7LYL5_9CHLR|nr:hypothetical protein [Chloroflexota bacterium]WJW67284.1 hypothetical protein OZ401_000544 [Chloroflexota bacterium L227-S17]
MIENAQPKNAAILHGVGSSILAVFPAPVLKTWLLWRVGLFIFPALVGMLIPPAEVPTALPAKVSDGWFEHLIWNWTGWDGGWYITIAEKGYTREGSNAFYPLFPHLVRWIGFVLGVGSPVETAYKWAGLLLASLAALFACVLLYRLVAHDYEHDTAWLSVAFLLAFPTSYYMVAVYSESLFLALALGAFLAARQQRWLLALVLAALATLTKNQGIFVALALLVEYGQQREWRWRKLDFKLLYFALPGLALVSWAAYNWANYGNPLAFLSDSQRFWKREFSLPWETMATVTGNFWNKLFDRQIWYPPAQLQTDMSFINVPLTYLFLLLLVGCGWLVWKGRMRGMYFVYFLFCLIQPLFAPATDVGLYSMSRFMLIIFPAFLFLAATSKRFPLLKQGYFTASLPLLGLLVARFCAGYWVA